MSGAGGHGGGMTSCGNGVMDSGEECDDSNLIGTDGCTSDCKFSVCGDGFVWSSHEGCDDGNLVAGDGCSASCRPEPVAVALGFAFTCAMSSIGAVKCWGYNAEGELGLGDTRTRGDEPGEMGENLPAVDLGSGRYALDIGAGERHACALLDDHTVKCWGFNQAGQLGVGDVEPRGDEPGEMGDHLRVAEFGRSVTSLAVREEHGCVLLDDHSVKCWGNSSGWGLEGAPSIGGLGLGNDYSHGYSPNQMGDNLASVELGTGRSAKSLTTGLYHTCAILDDDTSKCWGNNIEGELGLGDTVLRGNHPGEMGDSLPTLDLGRGRHALSLAAGSFHTCALLDDHSVKCWGDNHNRSFGIGPGTLGQGDTKDRGGSPGDMGDQLPTVDLGAGRYAVSISASDASTCALLDNGSVKCWGVNYQGELGIGDPSVSARGDEPGEMGDHLLAADLGTGRTARRIVANEGAVCAILDNGLLKCWGDNNFGRLGQGDDLSHGYFPGEMGDHLAPVDLAF